MPLPHRSRSLADRVAAFLGDLWYRLDRRHRRVVLRNLEFAFGPALTAQERERLARAVFAHFVRFGWEVLGLFILPLSFISRHVVILGIGHVEAALAQGKGVVMVTGHMGNWEYGVMAHALQNRPIALVARDLDHPLARRLARYLRERCGNRMLSKKNALKEMLTHLRQRGIVGIVMDQNTAEREGLLVDFFGRPARTTPAAATLGRRRDVPVVPALTSRLADGRHLLIFLPPIPMEKTDNPDADILRHLQEQNRVLEAWVRLHPEQYLWLHRRWKNQFPELYEDKK
jgi:KDO2-lipid IV(A) lauroyltransferase